MSDPGRLRGALDILRAVARGDLDGASLRVFRAVARRAVDLLALVTVLLAAGILAGAWGVLLARLAG